MTPTIALAIAAVAALGLALWLGARLARANAERKRMRDFALSGVDWLWERGPDLRFTYISPGIERFGMRPSDYLGKIRLDEMPPGTEPVVWERLKQSFYDRVPFRDAVLSRVGHDGVRHWFAVSGAPFNDADGKFAGFRGTVRIVTAAIAQESELAEKTRSLELLQERLIDFTAASSDWLWEQDAEARITYFARPGGGAPQASQQNLIGLRRWEMPGHWAAEKDMEAHKADLAARRPFRDFRFFRLGPSGDMRTLSVSGRPIFDEEGRFSGYRGTTKDITDEIAAAERSRVAEQRLLRAIEALSSAIAIFDADRKLVFYNRAYAEMLRLGDRLKTGMAYDKLVDALFDAGRLRTATSARLQWRYAGPDTEDAVREITFADGLIMERRIERLPDGGMAVIGSDVTQARARQREMNQKTQILERMIESLDEGIVVYDGDARLVAWNERARQLMNAPAGRMRIGSSFAESVAYQIERGDFGPVADVEAEVARRLDRNRRGVASSEEGWRPNGRYIQTRRTPLPDGGWVTLFLDLTERHQAEDALRQAKEAAEAANRTKSEFLAHMSHELRTPLNAVIGFSEIIFRELFGPVGEPRYVEYARDIHASGTHLLNVIGDILDISKAEAGTAELDEAPAEIADIAAASLRLIEPRATAGQVRVESRVAADLPQIRVDARRLKQVLINLLSNAVKFTPPGGRVELEAHLGPAGGAVLAVRDTGIGMRPQDIPRALEPFSQIDNALSRRFEGTGLGLPLSLKLVELHGGTLEIVSEPDKGTVVTVALPPGRTIAA